MKKLTPAEFYKIRRLSKKGLINREIAAKIGRSEATVSRVMQAHNWEDMENVNRRYFKRVKKAGIEVTKDYSTEPLYEVQESQPKNIDKIKHELIGLIQDSVDWTLTIEKVDKIVEVIINKYER